MPRGDQQRAAANLRPIRQCQHAGRAFDPHAFDFLRRENFHAKTPRLRDRAPGQIRSRSAPRENRDNFQCANSAPPVRRAPRVRSAACASHPPPHKPPPPDPPAPRRPPPNRKTEIPPWFSIPACGRLRRWEGCSETSRRETPPSAMTKHSAPGGGEQLLGRFVRLDVEPLMRHKIASEKIADLI